MGVAAALVYAAKNGFELLKEHISKKSEAKDSTPEPPKIQTIVDCVNSAGEPKKVFIPDMLREGGLSVLAGREGAFTGAGISHHFLKLVADAEEVGATDLDFAAAEEGDQEACHDGGENACFRGGSRCNAEGNGQRQGYDTNNYPGQEVLDQGLFGITIFQSCKQFGFEITFDFHKIYTLFFAAQR